jgi:hypothetical protein
VPCNPLFCYGLCYCSSQAKQICWCVYTDWIWGGTLSPVIDDYPIAWPLRSIIDMCCLAIGCGTQPILTLLLPLFDRLSSCNSLWHDSSHPLSTIIKLHANKYNCTIYDI